MSLFYTLMRRVFRMQDARCKIQDARYRMQDTGCKIQDARYRMQDAGYNKLDFLLDLYLLST